jgi:hypothetical protein
MAMAETDKWQEAGVNVRLKLSAMWTSVMFLYVYADLQGFYDPKLLAQIMEGNMGFLGPITQQLKLAVAVTMSIPAMMIFLSLALRANQSRWSNIVAGILYTAINVATLIMPSWFSAKYFESLEALLTLYIVWTAWKWPTRMVEAR